MGRVLRSNSRHRKRCNYRKVRGRNTAKTYISRHRLHGSRGTRLRNARRTLPTAISSQGAKATLSHS